MTEVDYSPEAYNRYMATRARVGNWAAETSSYAAQYTHPFESHQPRTTPGAFGPVPEVRPSDSISLYDPSERARAERERSRSRGREMGGERPSHPRARSIPNAHNRVHPGPPPPTPALPFYVSPQSQQHPDRSRAPPSSAYTTIDLSKFTSYAEGSEFRLPSLRAGETYMLIPPKGMRVEVIVRPFLPALSRLFAYVNPLLSLPSAPCDRWRLAHVPAHFLHFIHLARGPSRPICARAPRCTSHGRTVLTPFPGYLPDTGYVRCPGWVRLCPAAGVRVWRDAASCDLQARTAASEEAAPETAAH